MTTIWDFQPEVTATLTEGSFWSGLSADARAALWRTDEQTQALVAPLTRVESLAEAEALVSSTEVGYRRLAEQWAKVLRDSDVSATQLADDYRERNSALRDWQLPSIDDNERWQGVLDSEGAYVAWLTRQQGLAPSSDARLRGNQVAEETNEPLLRFLLVKRALVLAMASVPGPSPKTISALTTLVDQYMTQIEDIFLGRAGRDDDDGEVVPLAEVRADLGL